MQGRAYRKKKKGKLIFGVSWWPRQLCISEEGDIVRAGMVQGTGMAPESERNSGKGRYLVEAESCAFHRDKGIAVKRRV